MSGIVCETYVWGFSEENKPQFKSFHFVFHRPDNSCFSSVFDQDLSWFDMFETTWVFCNFNSRAFFTKLPKI